MKRIGLLSDTHGFIDDKVLKFFAECDEIWHAGDIGSDDVMVKLSEVATVRAVHGNIDNNIMRKIYPQHQRFDCENVSVWITHIGGYPGRYDRLVRPEIFEKPPKLFISGHSHILKVINDNKLNLLHINPGAAGKNGLHQVRTAVRFIIDKADIRDFELLEIDRR